MRHLLARHFMRQATQAGMAGWQKAWLKSHLAACPRCRAFGWALAEFLHEEEPMPALAASQAAALHGRICLAVEQAAKQPGPRVVRIFGQPVFSSTFFPSLAAACLIVALLVFLFSPSRRQDQAPQQGSNQHSLVLPVFPTPQPSPSPTPAPRASAPALLSGTVQTAK